MNQKIWNLTKVKVVITLWSGMVTVGNQGQDDRYIRLWRYVTSRGEQIVRLSRFRPSISIMADNREVRELLERLDILKFSFHQSSTKSPCKRLSNQNWFRSHAHARLARLVFFKAIWSKTIRFRLDLLRCCNINILRNLDVSVCGSWIKKEKAMATKATTLLLEASMVLEFPASLISWRRR